MHWYTIVLIILIILVIGLFVLYKLGTKLQKRQLDQKSQMIEAAQPVTMLIIDKKVLPMKDAGLPKQVMDQAPKRYHKAKLPIIKAKIGPQITNMICDDAIFDDVPTKGEVKAMVSGIYVLSVKSVRRKNAAAEEPEDGKKKKKRKTIRQRQAEYQRQLNDQVLANKQNKEKGLDKTKSKAELKKERERARKIKDGIN